jgi:diguanylate cyclase (GGDEF)-like protein
LTSIRWWWRQPDHFDWLVAYLRVRRMTTTTRGVLVAVTLCLAVVPLSMLFGSAPPVGRLGTTMSVLAGVGGLATALLWVFRFPTKNQSIAFSITASASIALAVVAQSDPLTAILGCTAFATISGYIALFHTAALMVANLVIVLSVSAVPAVALVHTDGAIRAASAYGVMLVVNIAVSYGVQIIVHTLGVDLLKADRDPLTGLYNRRAFYRRTAGLATANGDEGHLLIAMIDLDKFKRLNDTHGHTEGDLALAAVGRALRDHAPHGSVIGRAGGEEFLVAVDVVDAGPNDIGQSLCDAIEALPFPITASVGSACAPFDDVRAGDSPYAVITTLIDAADTAMYEAKRNGGNQTRHHRAPAESHVRAWSPATRRWEALPSSVDPRRRNRVNAPSSVAPGASAAQHVEVESKSGRDWSVSW